MTTIFPLLQSLRINQEIEAAADISKTAERIGK